MRIRHRHIDGASRAVLLLKVSIHLAVSDPTDLLKDEQDWLHHFSLRKGEKSDWGAGVWEGGGGCNTWIFRNPAQRKCFYVCTIGIGRGRTGGREEPVC
jgi:hypothetical protein